MPNLAVTWMFQRSMSARAGEATAPAGDFVNRLLRTNFDIMHDLGDGVQKPFLQDVVQFRGLAGTLLQATLRDPALIPQILLHVGLPAVAEWAGHFAALGLYTVLHGALGKQILTATDGGGGGGGGGGALAGWAAGLSASERFEWRRRAEAWKFGAGLDYQP